jgi:hypothetical protein
MALSGFRRHAIDRNLRAPMLDSNSNVMNDISFSEGDFCIVLFVLGGIGILVSGLLCFIQDLQGRRNRRIQILSTSLRRPSADRGKGTGPKHRRRRGASAP